MHSHAAEITTLGRSIRCGVLLFGVALLASNAAAQTVDTSEWLCEFCPFEQGARAAVTAGVTSVSDDTAWIGDATGYDEDGVYVALDATGSYAGENYNLRWAVEDLGVDARSAELDGGSPGRFKHRLSYRELPRRQYITTSTVYIEASDDRLRLPAAWVRAPSTIGMTELAGSLVARDIASDRSVLNVGGSVALLEGVSLSADYRRHEHDGLKIRGGALYTSASQLPLPFDYRTDEAELSLSYAGQRGSLSLGWYLSDFGNLNEGIAWDSPFTTVAGAETMRSARAPDSNFQQVRLSAGVSFPAQNTWVRFSAASGSIEQDQAFLPYTSNPNITTLALPRPNLGGTVDTGSYALAVTTRPHDKSRLRLSYRYDERDNQTAQSTWSRVIVDTFASGASEINIPYSFERSTLSVDADYDLLDSLRLSAAYERREFDRDFQEVAGQTENTGWGRVRWRPLASLELDARAGTSRREIDRYDETLAASFGQNPLLRKYNLAFRYREFGEVSATWSPAELPISVGFSAMLTNDSYTRSLLGMTSGDENLIALDFGWTLSEKTSLYANAGFDRIESTQLGSESFGQSDWHAGYEDSFYHVAAGLRVADITDRLDFELDLLRSDGNSKIAVGSPGGVPAGFPDLESKYDHLRAALTWRRSDNLVVMADLRWQHFTAEDWALQGVSPGTIPVVLSLGAEPWDEDVVMLMIGVRYRYGGATAP